MANGSVFQLPSGKWRIRWYTPDGRHLSRTFHTKRTAEAELRRFLRTQEETGAGLTDRSETLQSLIRPWWDAKERSVKPRTAERYQNHLKIIEASLIAREPLRLLDVDKVQAFVDSLSPRYAPATVRGIYGVLAMILAHGVQRKKVRTVAAPMFPATVPRDLSVPTPTQVEQLAAASDARVYAPIILAGYCGLRLGELMALEQEDVHLVEAWLLVRHARNKSSGAVESTKTGRYRRVFLPKRVVTVLVEHLDEYPGVRVVPVSSAMLSKSWIRARQSCGLDGVRFHDLRHAAASMMIAAGVNVRQVSQQLGHANATQTLDVYAHLWPTSYDDAIAKMDAYLAHD